MIRTELKKAPGVEAMLIREQLPQLESKKVVLYELVG
jgi:hypothetical protein